MAQVILGAVGGAVGGSLGATIGGLLGQSVDRWAIAGLEPARQRGPRLEALKVQGTAEGAPLACVLGRARVTGQVIWAARFRESRTTRRGGKGGPRTTEYGYLLSFAVALCEGEIDGIGRVWADGQAMDLNGVTMRVHRGGAEQAPDPLIEAVEGDAPAYHGTAYVVFEDLQLGRFGNRVPQLAFEVFNRARGSEPRLEDRLEGVCLIPGAGEFVLATDGVMRRDGLTRTAAENLHGGDGRADLVVSLDQLQAQCPNLKRVSLVIGWFGTDVRAAECRVRPGVERRHKPTEPQGWSVAGMERHEAHLISRVPGSDAPAYGGTPSDESVRQAVTELKARGLEVTLYPFVFMDVPGYPWRGRVAGRDGAQAGADVAAMFGAADGWGLRRIALHYALLAAETGADGLLIGSEMRGLTLTRDADGAFPAVEAFRALAGECRAVVGPGVQLSYAADWSEYAGLRAGDEARFHLDPLWADPAIDYVGIDWYPPLGDWRAGDGGVDGAAWGSADDPDYLAAQIAGGEGFAWFYASDGDRAAQVRTPIEDTAHGEHWLYRVKDLAGWWGHAHHDRIAGVRQAAPTAWTPGMKPIRLTEFGCAAVDRGGNAPNLFQDPKSTEDALPPHSTGARDDRMQRRAMEALLNHHADSAMVEAMDAWCWDARPWPAFPGRTDVWADAGAWRTGHWLNGRLGGQTRDLIAAILTRGGLEVGDFEVGEVDDGIEGYVIDRPMRTRDALEPLLSALGLTAAERGGRVAIFGDEAAGLGLSLDALALDDEGAAVKAERVLERQPREARVRFIDGGADYQTGSATARQAGEGGGVDLALPAVCTAATGRAVAERALATAGGERLTVRPGPLELLALEPGDVVTVEGREGDWRVARLDLDETPTAVLESVVRVSARDGGDGVRPPEPPARPGAPFFRMIELPPLIGSEADGRPLAVVAGDPWRPMTVWAGATADALTARGEVAAPATVGTLVEPLGSGVRNRIDGCNSLLVRIEGRSPESRSLTAVLAGANAVAIETAAGWEIAQFRTATLVAGGVWRLSGLLRAQQGTEEAMRAGAPAGALVVVLEAQISRAELASGERGLPLIWRAAPAGALAGGAGVSEVLWKATGVHGRPWSPAHLKLKARADGGRDLAWIARSRIDGDRWDGESAPADPMRFRVRVLDGEGVVRSWEVDGAAAVYLADELTADFPDGVPEGSRLAVAQRSDGYGWGVETSIALI